MTTDINSTKQRASLVFPLFLCSISLVYLVSAILLGSPVSNGRLTTTFFPMVVGGGALTLAVTLLFRALSERRDASQKTVSQDKLRPLIVMLATLAYILTFSALGYLVASVAYVLAIILLFSDFSRLFGKVAIAIILTLLGYLLFEQIFRVRLPTLWG